MIDKQKITISKLEMIIYQLLGIRIFRKIVMAFEQIRHRKDGRTNTNYHLDGLSCVSARRFYAYLSYNALIHLISLLCAMIYFVIRLCAHLDCYMPDVLVYILIAINLYCIMLQRYTCLKIRHIQSKYDAHRREREKKRAGKIGFPDTGEYGKYLLRNDFLLLKGLQEAIESGCDFFLDSENAGSLERLACLLDNSGNKRISKCIKITQKSSDSGQDNTIVKLVTELKADSFTYNKVQRRVDKLQRISGRKTDRVLAPFAVITADREVENNFAKLFAADSPDSIREITETLLLSLEGVIHYDA